MARIKPTGARIRDRRLASGLKQREVAQAAGISPSYLALIEGGKRPIGGALLGKLAGVLDVSRDSLSEEADGPLVAAVEAAAGAAGLSAEEVTHASDLVARHPGWARLIAGQARDLERARDRIAALSDRMIHDPALADAMHEVLSTVASIRSTTAILAQTPDLEPIWRGRFHANLDGESRRLAEATEAIVAYFDRQPDGDSPAPAEAVAAALDPVRGDPPEGEARTRLLDGLPHSARPLAEARLAREADDAQALPIAMLDGTPSQIARRSGQPLSRVLRRLAATDPARGLVVVDASGALTLRRPVAGFPLPVIGAGCPLWPVYAAFSRPLHPVDCVLQTPDGANWHATATAEVVGHAGGHPVLEATMLVTRTSGAEEPLGVGPGCRVCPRQTCPARREPSLLSGVQAGQGD
ncbi:XRE family transcriptional regulator [Jannaschia aquimarina]|uniref:Anaerobic benzoate catabolism transcriptional regulator n=1 Tax=Jannaschia aquimarina TaxID=935700 RepID=A0A0D1CIB2_9RHOB|nr:XRE family transcriptional regulator [Jannaschia aquimarina]KIT14432.1 anaerobic benzoate catabolism transcriptional regulator [Jannaschia aquimarina]SNT29444.1 hypothetical protein SAMN05421775_11079 [Jannaschia aquimarina]